jgi:hypothetical protein
MPDPSDMFSKLAQNREKKKSTAADVGNLPTDELAATPKRGRAKGKRSDPNYIQVGAYIPKELDRQVKRLLVDEDNLDFSNLVAQLLEDWVKRKSD